MKKSMFQRCTSTASAWTRQQSIQDRCASTARTGWHAIRTSRLPAEAIIGLASSPAGYDALVDAATAAARATGKGAALTALVSRRAAAAVTSRVAAGIGRVHGPSGTSVAHAATAADARLAGLAARLHRAATVAGIRVAAAAASPAARQATTMTASAARIIIAANRVTSGGLVSHAAKRGVIVGRLARATTNPWILLGTVAGSLVVATGVTAFRDASESATSPSPARPTVVPQPTAARTPGTTGRTGNARASKARAHRMAGKKAA